MSVLLQSQLPTVGRITAPRQASNTYFPTAPSVITFWALHAPLALAMSKVPMLATGHALACVCLGAALSLAGARPDRIVNLMAYIAGSEVLWRMCKAPLIFWESGKYALVLVSCLAAVRGHGRRNTAFPWLYFGALLPSTPLTATISSFDRLRKSLSFNLSGPLALASCARLFSLIRLSHGQLSRALLTALAPIIGVLAVTVFNTTATKKLVFGAESNFQTSGGFGPNQVSSVLGFGAFIALLSVLLYGKQISRLLKHALMLVALACATQSALTFSRTGLYLAGASLAVAATYGLRDKRLRLSILVAGTVCYLVAAYLVAPMLNQFTGGAIGKRFGDSGLTRRDELMKADFLVWQTNIVLGVGPGLSPMQHEHHAATHSEFTRLLAEHGLFGLFSLSLLLYNLWKCLREAKSVKSKTIVAAMSSFGLLFLASTAMRVALPAFAIGLAFVTYDDA